MCLAIPAQVVEIVPGIEHHAVVDVVGVRRRIDTGLLEDPPVPGDWVLVHVGFAMSKISAEYAAEQMDLLKKLGESEAARQEAEGYGSGDSGP
jgi:hydrogenase expression/formation protein HypC